MARFSTILSVTVLVIAYLYMVNVVTAIGEECSTPDGCSPRVCPALSSGAVPKECCNDLREGVGADGKVYAIQKGTCTCCRSNEKCETLAASSLADTPHTQSTATAVDINCKVPQQGSKK